MQSTDSDLNNSLVEACREGKLQSVKALCKYGADVNTKTECGESPLLAAIDNDNEEIVSYLVDKKADVNLRVWMNSPLNKALEKGNGKILNILYAHGARLRNKSSDHLYCALNNDKRESIHFLIKKLGADVNIKSSYSHITPLYWAAKNNDLELAHYLINHGANKEEVNNFDETPLFAAVCAKNSNLVRLLIASGANINHCTSDHNNHHTAFFFLVMQKDLALAKEFIDKKAEINIINSHNKTPLHYAIENGDEPMAKLLLEHKADPNLVHPNSVGQPALCVAAAKNSVPLTTLLIDRGADIDKTDYYGLTALAHAREEGSLEAFEVLLKAGADKSTALHKNIMRNKLNPEIERILNQTKFQSFWQWTKSTRFSVRISALLTNVKTHASSSWTRLENTSIIGSILKKLRFW